MECNNYNNALLLYAVYETQQDNNGSGLKNIIAYADYANHAIMTYEEFDTGIKYLLENELIKIIDKRIFVENIFVEWFENKYKNTKRIYVLKAVERVQKYLNKLDIKSENTGKVVETNISENDFQNSINEYLKR